MHGAVAYNDNGFFGLGITDKQLADVVPLTSGQMAVIVGG